MHYNLGTITGREKYKIERKGHGKQNQGGRKELYNWRNRWIKRERERDGSMREGAHYTLNMLQLNKHIRTLQLLINTEQVVCCELGYNVCSIYKVLFIFLEVTVGHC